MFEQVVCATPEEVREKFRRPTRLDRSGFREKQTAPTFAKPTCCDGALKQFNLHCCVTKSSGHCPNQ
jgi:hypothetical protein